MLACSRPPVCGCCVRVVMLQSEASKLLAELEQLRSISGDHAALEAENARLKGAHTAGCAHTAGWPCKPCHGVNTLQH